MARVLSPQEVAAMIVASRREDDQPRFARRKSAPQKPQSKPVASQGQSKTGSN